MALKIFHVLTVESQLEWQEIVAVYAKADSKEIIVKQLKFA